MAVNIDWRMIAAFPNAGEAFQKGLEHGREQRKQAMTENALAAYATNPDDPRAVNALIAADPRLGIQVKAQQVAQAQAAQEKQAAEQQKRVELIGRVALAAHDPESWDKMVDYITPAFPDAAQYKGKYDPAMRSALIARAGLKDEGEKPDLVVIDGVAIDKRTGQPLFESPYPRIVSGPGGIYEQPRIGIGRGGTGTAKAGKVVVDALPPGWAYEDTGGPSPDGSGNFP